jgi:hypothetical protein
VVFVADDLGAWLVGVLADAGRKKLTGMVLGSEQERALRRAADAAVWATAEEMNPSGGERTVQIATVISEVFHDPVPEVPIAGPVLLLEGLQAGIAGQLAVLDDAELTGTGQSSADVLGVPGTVLADRLTGHLVREIIFRGSGGGPLTPLADQFNHELTRGILARLAGEVRVALARADSGFPNAAGWPLAYARDPFALEVHRPVDPDVPQASLPALPAYVPREHDAALAEVVTAAAAGTSGIAVLVGGSSTGKTRACWEVLALLRELEPGWRLWHPIDPHGALAELPGVEPRTVVWLNEAQRYLDTADGTGERAAAGLRELLRNPARGPVLVLATLWPEYWDQLTARPPGVADSHAQARELLDGHDIPVPAAFTAEQLLELREAEDPRLAQATSGSRDGQVIQYLAGAKELLDRYHNAPPAARALIDAAMDARRLGMRTAALPEAFLETAAPGYLTDTDWNLQPPDWLQQGLAYTHKPVKGILGPLAPIRPRPASGGPASPSGGPTWQLADYLDQRGRRMRHEKIPPASFWDAVTRCADPADLAALAEAAWARGQTLAAARLYKQACAHGDTHLGAELVFLMHDLDADDQRPADWAAVHAGLDNASDVWPLLYALSRVGTPGQVTILASRAAAHASLDYPWAVERLLDALRQARATGQITTLLDRDPAAHARLDKPDDVAHLLDALRKAGATGQITALLDRVAGHAPLGDPRNLAGLLDVLCDAGATAQVTVLASRAAADARLDNPAAVANLLDALHKAGASEQVTTLLHRDPAAHARLDKPDDVESLLDALKKTGATGQGTTLLDRAVAHAPFDDPLNLARLLRVLREAGASEQVTALASRAAAHARLDNPDAVHLLRVLREAGATAQVTALASRAAAHARLDNPQALGTLLSMLRQAGATGQIAEVLDRNPAVHARLNDPFAVATLLYELREAGASEQVTTLASRAAAHVPLDGPGAVARLLETLREAGASEQVTTLLKRDPAAYALLHNPEAVAWLLRALRDAGASEQVTTLASRAAADARLDNLHAADQLLGELHQAGASAQAAELTERLPAAGLFNLFLRQEGRDSQFRFGREADGRPAKPWGWTDLG